MSGGARYNSTGIAGVGIGNVGDSLNIINHVVFDKKICTARELYDALAADWSGYEELHRYIKNEAPHYGNGIESADKHTRWAAGVFCGCGEFMHGTARPLQCGPVPGYDERYVRTENSGKRRMAAMQENRLQTEFLRSNRWI